MSIEISPANISTVFTTFLSHSTIDIQSGSYKFFRAGDILDLKSGNIAHETGIYKMNSNDEWVLWVATIESFISFVERLRPSEIASITADE